MYRVEWMRTAHDDLEKIYPSSDQKLNVAIRKALDLAEERLMADAHHEGESRADQDRIVFFPVLFAYFVVPNARLLMKIHYDFGPDDYEAFLTYEVKQSAEWRQHFLLRSPMLALFLALVCVYFSFSFGENRILMIPVALVVIPLLLFINRCFYENQALRNIDVLVEEGRRQRIYGPNELELTDGRLIARSEGKTIALDIDLIDRWTQTKTHLFLYTDENSAHVIPLVFLTQEELNAFLHALEHGYPQLETRSDPTTAFRESVRED